ncbi:DUF2231 domain-containing protein [Ornithinimicrobium cerasi]|uniref:Uncharacterized membrane protein n=1 Tax=Ornithinimicrobium cerasi TaxID=2248773 RepID=A0A285VBH6_9MICO|nr:DUF2231 domain-containing protein [Ornithinimicrobium cerasi]SOC51465.1 Uncharacterized membrane protein [Ornithinimicrobium cerasi]
MTQPQSLTTSPGALLGRMVESASGLDASADRLRTIADALVSRPWRRDLLRAAPLGHALHPVLTDVPIGTWMSAMILDLSGDRMADASRRLVLVGNLASLPTALTGLAEYSGLDQQARRVGSAHAAANALALGLSTWSWIARRGGHHATGRVLTGAALATGGLGAFLGGHLSIAMKVGSVHPDAHGSVEEPTPSI